MIKALAVKEWREVRGIAALALGCYVLLVGCMIGQEPFVRFLPSGRYSVPFIGTEFVVYFSFISILFTLALGFRQSSWEAGQGTYQFLLHRPIRRDVIFLTKLATGIVIFLICGSVPILLYAWWAATPGHHPSPFEWSMTTPSWQAYFLMPLVYLGAFMSGLRPARWFGTRLLPLAACGLIVMALMFLPWWWLLAFPLALICYLVLTANICYVARMRDYS
jgi:hypothetical protein